MRNKKRNKEVDNEWEEKYGIRREMRMRREIRNLFVFVALRPKSTAMVIAGRSVHLTTLFPGQA